MAQLPISIGNFEFTDGVNFFTLATENFIKNYVNKINPCQVATTGLNLTAIYNNVSFGVGATLTNAGAKTAISIDGNTLIVGDRVLVKDQTNPLENGIYVVTNVGSGTTNWVLTRAADFDSSPQMFQGVIVDVINGVTNNVSGWMLTSQVLSVGNDAIVFKRFAKTSIDNVVGTINQIVVTVSNNIATISIAPNPIIAGTGGITLPSGTTAQRQGGAATLRFNTSL